MKNNNKLIYFVVMFFGLYGIYGMYSSTNKNNKLKNK